MGVPDKNNGIRRLSGGLLGRAGMGGSAGGLRRPGAVLGYKSRQGKQNRGVPIGSSGLGT